ncbi:sigma-70 family RNA polymerase sigma factor [Nocardiopsis flavescens]|nr:sigma-70 family RNA polymerase sigma factor [Nocardiopsis flavescens]
MRSHAEGKVGSGRSTPDRWEVLAERIQKLIVGGSVDASLLEREFEKAGIKGEKKKRIVSSLRGKGVLIATGNKASVTSVERDSSDPDLAMVIPLARRYVHSGALSRTVLAGIARMCGLGGTRELVRLLKARGVVLVGPEPDVIDAVPAPRAIEKSQSVQVPTVSEPPDTVPQSSSSGVAAAVNAARRRMERDRKIARVDRELLTAQEELGLFYLIRGVNSPDVQPTEQDLAALALTDERRRAYETFFLHNTRLVHSEARTRTIEGFDHDDIAHYGMEGLMHAVVKFDGRLGNKFSTYAMWWIRQKIDRQTKDDAGPIRFPIHVHEQLAKVVKAERKLEVEGRPLRPADIAMASGLSVDKVLDLRRISTRVDSLDRTIRGDTPLMDLVAGDPRNAHPSPEEEVVDRAWRAQIRGLLDPLTERERRILELRMGFDGEEPWTLDAIGHEFGVTRERIRQLEAKSLGEIAERFQKEPPKNKKGRGRKKKG